jgi:NAD(P)H-quinone oxidoreductase subunit 5
VPEALLLLSLIGTTTAVLGMFAMWAQVKVKRTLAWSTVAQMGFMMVQCGLAAFPAAFLLILGHGCYKAWSFLRSGDLPAPGSYVAPASPGRTLLVAACGMVVSIPAIALACGLVGFTPWHSPGELALTAMVSLSMGQVWVAMVRTRARTEAPLAVLTTFAACFALFALYRIAGVFLEPVIHAPAPSQDPIAWLAAAIPLAAFTTLVVIHPFLPVLERSARGRAFHVHAMHGFYLGAVADRLVDLVWSRFWLKGAQHG